MIEKERKRAMKGSTQREKEWVKDRNKEGKTKNSTGKNRDIMKNKERERIN